MKKTIVPLLLLLALLCTLTACGQQPAEVKMLYDEAPSRYEYGVFVNMNVNAGDAVKEQLRTVAWTLDCGDDDGLLGDTFELYKKMRLSGIKAEFRVRNGVHNWEYWRHSLRQALPFASRNFAK